MAKTKIRTDDIQDSLLSESVLVTGLNKKAKWQSKSEFLGSLSGNRVINEVPTGLVNGTNNVFTALNLFLPSTLEVWVDGVKLKIVEDYNTTGQTITLLFNLQVNETILLNYNY